MKSKTTTNYTVNKEVYLGLIMLGSAVVIGTFLGLIMCKSFF